MSALASVGDIFKFWRLPKVDCQMSVHVYGSSCRAIIVYFHVPERLASGCGSRCEECAVCRQWRVPAVRSQAATCVWCCWLVHSEMC